MPSFDVLSHFSVVLIMRCHCFGGCKPEVLDFCGERGRPPSPSSSMEKAALLKAFLKAAFSAVTMSFVDQTFWEREDQEGLVLVCSCLDEDTTVR